MKLQIALDFFSINTALQMMKILHPYVDIIEIGSPLVYAEGFRAITKMKEAYPDLMVLADLKIVDGGYEIGREAYKAGADIVTAVGMTNDITLKGVINAARENKKQAMADAIGVADLSGRVQELDRMGFDYILLHTAHDTLGHFKTPVEDMKKVKKYAKNSQIGISGGINETLMGEVKSALPDWIVVGSGITKAQNPLKAIQTIRELM
ncbi:hypothetical protein B5E77_02775 [Lachnoclostridium sp. An131]|uniref:3-hexulose-6-phosphate synthase n=1 Tax=Lachnoclostridium sp. An131 TaxID=1965555 RepID=UPI000B39706B|nr:3-hexulose-6-phosphate synthase [Lachnoclostridium sp. An131]OUQ28693.1 hypothetical protein B5E77_02775 [Lachnoclostridium sp. An131]